MRGEVRYSRTNRNCSHFEDVPASVPATHSELFRHSSYRIFSNPFIGGTVSRDLTMHSLAPVTSVLDMKDPSNPSQNAPFTLSAESAGLLMVRPSSGGPVQHPLKRFGFPHLSYPSNPYLLTPYDGVYAVGDNNLDVNNNPKPDNQCHVEDVQSPVADYLSQAEVAPIKLYLCNHTVGASASARSGCSGGYKAEFEAREKIIAGNTEDGTASIYLVDNTSPLFLSPQGDFKVAVGTSASLHAGESVVFYPGTEFPEGCEVAAYIQPFPSGTGCSNVLNRQANKGDETISVISNGGQLSESSPAAVVAENVQIYPNPAKSNIKVKNYSGSESSELLIYNLSGQIVQKSMLNNEAENSLELNQLENGIYFLRVDGKNFKLIISK